MTDDEFQKHVAAFFHDYIDHIYMNYINPDPEQKIIELEESITQNDQNLQNVEAENARLRADNQKLLRAIEDIKKILHCHGEVVQ